jgi:crossover junction endodeoxyribonuclease RuvC
MRRILGIDPGSRVTGVGIIEQATKSTTPVCIFGGCIRLNAKEMPMRLNQLFHEIQDVVKI